MSGTTSKGIQYPANLDNTRLWEWFQNLATTADSIIIGNVDVQVFTTSGSWTKPSGAILVIVEVVGGGGGSGGCPSTDATHGACATGGGGGEYARGAYKASDLSSSVSVTVGAGGSAGSAGANNGGNGGTSSFGAIITAVGGGGGLAGTSTTGSLSTGGGDGGSGGTGGQVRIAGGDGGNGIVLSTTPIKCNHGGGAHLSQQQRPSGVSIGSTSGFDGNAYGGGASGSSNGPTSNPAVAGNAGGAGVIIVTTLTA